MAKKRLTKSVKSSEQFEIETPENHALPSVSKPRRGWSLATFVRDDNEHYRHFVALIAAGASPSSAAACVRLSETTWREWVRRYKMGDTTPLIRKLGDELFAAIGGASALAEVEVRKGNPAGWLKGPSRSLLSDDYSPTNENNAVPSSTTPNNVTNNVLILSSEVQRDALKALEAAGIITVRRTNAEQVVDAR